MTWLHVIVYYCVISLLDLVMDRLGSPSLPPIEIDSIMKKSQTRVWKTLNGEPEFITYTYCN